MNIECFSDEIHLCLCHELGGKHLSNCFQFDDNMSIDCFGLSECVNGGRCLQSGIDSNLSTC